jgi:hypothetical protein
MTKNSHYFGEDGEAGEYLGDDGDICAGAGKSKMSGRQTFIDVQTYRL